MCLRIARGVRRLHIAGLAHSDLSYKNVLVNPARGTACIIDIDGLVVPGKFPPDVVGTPDFIAPEVVRTAELPLSDPNKNLPRRQTDEHALAVLIYMYLLYRHPLRGGRLLHQDPGIEESLMMGEKALFVEHPTDPSNRINVEERKPTELPWVDTNKMPYKIVGPYLGKLFERAFIDGLHDPSKRPSANDWEIALVETMDLLQPCKNPDCEEGWYVFDNSTAPRCPFCGTPYQGKLPVLNLYSSRDGKDFRSDNVRLMVWTGQSLFEWHTNRLVLPNEKLCGEQLKRVGYFVFHQERWWLVNERLPNMVDYTESQGGRSIPVGGKVELREGAKVLMSSANGGRLFQVQMVNG
jgi:DNA-binding helix-hairpin-helix protein with protein kinase domain